VSPTTQPLPALPAASTTPSRTGDLTRLLTTWRDLTARAAQAAAHNTDQELMLIGLQHRVEQAITERHPGVAGVMDDLLTWELTLAHTGTGPIATCLDCRRARVGFPDSRPFPSPRQGA